MNWPTVWRATRATEQIRGGGRDQDNVWELTLAVTGVDQVRKGNSLNAFARESARRIRCSVRIWTRLAGEGRWPLSHGRWPRRRGSSIEPDLRHQRHHARSGLANQGFESVADLTRTCAPHAPRPQYLISIPLPARRRAGIFPAEADDAPAKAFALPNRSAGSLRASWAARLKPSRFRGRAPGSAHWLRQRGQPGAVLR